MSEEDRSRLYAWFREQTDEPLTEYLMSCLAPAPLSDLATKADIGKLESRFDQLLLLRKSDRAEATALRKSDRAEATALRESDRAEATALRKSDRNESKRQFHQIIGLFIGMTGVIVAVMFGVVAIT